MRAPGSAGNPSEGRTPLALAMLVGSGLCCLVTVWLLVAVVLVLPARAPATLASWTFVAVSFVLLATVGAWRSMRASGSPVGEVLAGAVGATAIAGGAMLVVPMAAGSVEFEGYVVILGAVAMTQGALILVSVLVRWRTR